MSDVGDHVAGKTVMIQFSTSVNGVMVTLAGSPVISVYKNSTTESTAGVTLTVDYDGRTGMHHVAIDTSADTSFYAPENDFSVVVTTGTIAGLDLTGTVVGSFSLSTQRKGLDRSVSTMARGTVTTGASTTSLPTSAFTIANIAATGVVSDQFKGRTIIFDGDTTTAGLRGAAATISASSASNTPTLTVGTLPATPASGDTFTVV